ncbi:MAG TPA: ATP-binding protein, partial [Polyangia bacterium]|nr:ATP-binding protein [Polyangia bacterium]
MRGFTVEESLSHTIDQILAPGSLEVALHALAEELALEAAGGAEPDRSRTLELEHFRKDGSTTWLEVSLSFVRDEAGRPTGVLAVSRDISERRRAEAERHKLAEQVGTSQRLEAVGHLAGGIAHDFNNLLTVIISYTGFGVESLPAGNPLRADLEEVYESAKRAANLTRQLLAFSRRQVLEPRILDLGGLVTGLGGILPRLLGEDIDLELRPAGEPCTIEADPGQIEQVIMNLAVNARDAMPTGGKLTIETTNVDLDDESASGQEAVPAGEYVMLSVTDTGAGMDAETRERAFEPFFTTKDLGQGTGLGLSTAYGIVKQSGGGISVHSEPGRGTRFEIHLPRVSDRASGLAAAGTPPPVATGNETVLVAEDEPAIRALAARILTGLGYRVLAAGNGDEALAVAKRQKGRIDLLLTDVVMPGISGRQLADRLRAIRPGLRVLFMSGHTDNAIVHHGVLKPGTHLIGKPFEAEQLARRIREVLDGPPDGP